MLTVISQLCSKKYCGSIDSSSISCNRDFLNSLSLYPSRTTMAFNSTPEVQDCDTDGKIGDCIVCRDVWNRTVPAEIHLEKTKLPACVDCFLTERWLRHTVQNSAQDPVKASRLLRQCGTCIAESSYHPWVNWRFCVKCCQHVCGSSLKEHPCRPLRKVVSFKIK